MAYILLAITAWCWGLNAVLGQLAVGTVSPMLLVVLRWVGVLLLLLVFARKSIAAEIGVIRPHWRLFALLGTVGFTGFNALFYIASHHTSGVNVGILQGSIPVIVMLGAFIAYRTPVTAWQCIGVAITLVGVFTVTLQGDLSRIATLNFNIGDLYMLLACLLYASYTVGLRRLPGVSPLVAFSALALVALLAAIPLAVCEFIQGDSVWPTPKGWAVVVFVTLFPSFLAQVFFIQGVAMIGPGRAGIFVNLVPIFASLMAVFFLEEPFRRYHGIALALVLVGIGVAEFSRSHRQSS